MNLNKRSLLRGLAGAGLVGPRALAHAAQTAMTPDRIYQNDPGGAVGKCLDPPLSQIGIDPIFQIKQAFLQQAENEGDKMRAKLHRQMDALQDIHSISNAYRRTRDRELQNQLEQINDRLRLLRIATYT